MRIGFCCSTCYDRRSHADRDRRCGGVGGYFGGRLAAAGADVTFLARGAHLEAMRARGPAHRQSEGQPAPARASTPSAIRRRSARSTSCSSPSSCTTPRRATACCRRSSDRTRSSIPFQNGVDSVDVLTRAVGRPHTAGGIGYVSAVIAEPGVIEHTAMDHLIFGELDGSTIAAARGAARGVPSRGLSGDAQRGHRASTSGRSSSGCRSSAA